MAEATTKKVSPKKNIYQRIADVASKVEKIPKNGYNEFHKYHYSTEADILEGVKNLLLDAGLMVIPSVIETEVQEATRKTKDGETSTGFRRVNMMFTIVDIATGETVITFFPGEGQDGGDKGFYKAETGAQKYFLMKTFMIPTGDDPEATPHQTQEPKPASTEGKKGLSENALKKLNLALKYADVDDNERARMKVYYGVAHFEELSSKQMTEIIDRFINAGKITKDGKGFIHPVEPKSADELGAELAGEFNGEYDDAPW